MAAPHLLVDAYNVIHAWPDLRAALLHHGPDAARAQLAEAVRPIHDSAGWRVSLVFDGRGPDLLIERPGPDLTFSYVYGPAGLTADAIIEQIVLNSTLPSSSAQPTITKSSSKKISRHALRASKGKKSSSSSPLSAPSSSLPPPDHEIVVVTRDNLLGEATAAAGARTLSPDGLRDWAQSCAAQQSRILATRSRRSQSSWHSAPSPWDKLSKPPSP